MIDIKLKTKKSFTLLITIFVVVLFSYLAIITMQTKALSNTNIQNQYLYIQAYNHKEFLKSYIYEIDLKDINHIEINDDLFTIYADIKKDMNSFDVDIYVKSKEFDISIYENFTIR